MDGAQNPRDWWDENGDDVLTRHAHVEQKLSQLGDATAALRAMRSQVGLSRDWLRSIERVPGGGLRSSQDMLDPIFFARIASTALAVRHALTNAGLLEVPSVAAPPSGAATAAVEGAATVADDQAAERAAFNAQVERVFDTAEEWTGGGIGDVVDRFGLGSEVDDGLGWFVVGQLWGTVTSPFQTYQSHKFSHMALDAWERFQDAHGADLSTMSSAFHDAELALEDLGRALDGARLDDPTSTLGGQAASDLRALSDEYARLTEWGAPPGVEGMDLEGSALASEPPGLDEVDLDGVDLGVEDDGFWELDETGELVGAADGTDTLSGADTHAGPTVSTPDPGAPSPPVESPLEVLSRNGNKTTYRKVVRGVTLEFTLTN